MTLGVRSGDASPSLQSGASARMVKPGSLAFPGGGARHPHGVPFLSTHDFAWPGGWALPPFMTPPLASGSVTPTPHGSHEVPPRVKAHRADLEKYDLPQVPCTGSHLILTKETASCFQVSRVELDCLAPNRCAVRCICLLETGFRVSLSWV